MDNLDNLVGKEILNYRVKKKAGEGHYSYVYEAVNGEIGKRVAVKQLKPGYSAEQLRREGEILCKLHHPNIVAVLNYDSGMGVLVEEWLNYETLEQHLSKKPGRGLNDVLEQIISAVDYAHSQGIVHGDLHAGNIILIDGNVKIVDFGMNCLSGSGSGKRMDNQKTQKDDIKSIGHIALRIADYQGDGGLYRVAGKAVNGKYKNAAEISKDVQKSSKPPIFLSTLPFMFTTLYCKLTGEVIRVGGKEEEEVKEKAKAAAIIRAREIGADAAYCERFNLPLFNLPGAGFYIEFYSKKGHAGKNDPVEKMRRNLQFRCI